jgi:hypothetical protein
MLALVLATGVVGVGVFIVDIARPDCGTFAEDAASFRAKSSDTTLRARAERLVRCGHLVGRTPEEVTAALGLKLGDNPQLSYPVGIDAASASNTEVSLFMQAAGGRVVYASVSGETREVEDGEPVS